MLRRLVPFDEMTITGNVHKNDEKVVHPFTWDNAIYTNTQNPNYWTFMFKNPKVIHTIKLRTHNEMQSAGGGWAAGRTYWVEVSYLPEGSKKWVALHAPNYACTFIWRFSRNPVLKDLALDGVRFRGWNRANGYLHAVALSIYEKVVFLQTFVKSLSR